MKVFHAFHSQRVPPRPLPLHTQWELKYLCELMGDVFTSPDALRCLFVTLVGYECLKGQSVVKWWLPWGG